MIMEPMPFLGFSDPFSSWSHLIAGFSALLSTALLVAKGRGNAARLFSLIVFSFSLVFLFSMSGVFHLLSRESISRGVLQRLDHAGIWVLIAGTFTPIHTILFRGPRRWLILLAVWVVAITGLVLEVVFFHDFPESLLLMLFLGLGWVGALTSHSFRKIYGDSSIWLLIGGGVFYSIGAAFDFTRWPVLIPNVIGAHEIFHVFVIAGALSHWLFIYRWAHHPVSDSLTFHVYLRSQGQVLAHAIGDNIVVESTSVSEVKALIHQHVAKKFHTRIVPKIRLRYFNEEYL
jgi:channel protein (hemolysin III family)